MTGIFITLEGGEGAGKSTQCHLLAEHLSRDGYDVVQTREPGGSGGAERLRTLLLAGAHGLCLQAEILVLLAARLDHVHHTIAPALARGAVVLCDRFTDSTVAYQGHGLGQTDPGILGFIEQAARLIPISPDLTLLLDVSRATSLARVAARGDALDRYERLGEDFHRRVADAFSRIAVTAPDRVVRIDADRPVAAVQADIAAATLSRLATHLAR